MKNFDTESGRLYAESVHLENWPKATSTLSSEESAEAIERMQKTRDVVEHVLALRNKANIKVRQPLQSLSLPGDVFAQVHVHILQDELNIKEIIVSTDEHMSLNTTVTEELRIEGLARDVIREIQSKRKDLNLVPTDTISVVAHVEEGLQEDYVRIYNVHMHMFTDIANVASYTVSPAASYALEVIKQ